MSASICRRCFNLIKEEQRVGFVATAIYHVLKSTVHYAIDPKTMEIDPETLVHADEKECEYDNDDYPV